MESKQEVRKRIRVLKRELTLEQKMQRSEPIMHKVEALPAFQMAHTVLLYWSMADEVQTHEMVEQWYRQKTVLLPCVDGDDLRLRQYTGPECMVSGEQFGIGEPTVLHPQAAPVPLPAAILRPREGEVGGPEAEVRR